MVFFNSDIKKISIIALKTLGIYLVLSVFFYGYMGLVDPRGGYFSEWLAKYNLVELLSNAIVIAVKFLLSLLGYNVISYNNNVSMANEKGILIFDGCLGIGVMMAYTALIFGYPGKFKLPIWITGLLFVQLLNVIRMSMIVVTIKKNLSIVELSHDVFNYVAYALILALFYFWVKKNEAYTLTQEN